MPKLHDKAIIRLDIDEVAMLLDYVESAGEHLTGQALAYYQKTKNRDLAILTLLLGTGIRVSECVGLNLTDVDFKNNGITVTRKGGSQMVVYFGDEVADALENYIEADRKVITPLSGHEEALFLSTQRKRMGVQAIENMVKKYARQVTPNKKITPHKLRSTYGTSLYKETGDIFNQEVAGKFRKYILTPGCIDDAMDMYVNFRGKEPGIDPLLKNRGLK